IGLDDAIARLTSSIGVKLDAARHSIETIQPLRDVLKKHPGKKELYVQVPTRDGKRVSLRINGDFGVRVTRDLVTDLETLLGPGGVQLTGEGSRRQKQRAAQQPLFKEAAPDPAEMAMASADDIAPMDAPIEE